MPGLCRITAINVSVAFSHTLAHAAMGYAQGFGLVGAVVGALPSIGEGLAESHRDQSFYQRHRERLAGAEPQRA